MAPAEDNEDDDFPLLLQVSLHALIECLSIFQQSNNPTFQSNNMTAQLGGGQRDQRSIFNPIRTTLRLVYENDGQPFLIMSHTVRWRVLMVVRRREEWLRLVS